MLRRTIACPRRRTGPSRNWSPTHKLDGKMGHIEKPILAPMKLSETEFKACAGPLRGTYKADIFCQALVHVEYPLPQARDSAPVGAVGFHRVQGILTISQASPACCAGWSRFV